MAYLSVPLFPAASDQVAGCWCDLSQHRGDNKEVCCLHSARATFYSQASLLGSAGVKQFMSSCLQDAQSAGSVKTLLQRVRPIAGLAAVSHRDKSAAERKVVNSILQVSRTGWSITSMPIRSHAAFLEAWTAPPFSAADGPQSTQWFGSVHSKALQQQYREPP